MTDKRRYGVIEVSRISAEPVTYHLTIDGVMWSEVEWSSSRQQWCIQDACGMCLAHTEHIVGQDRDVETAIRLAKRMIVDGRMPTPEEARRQLQQRRLRENRKPKTASQKASVPESKNKQPDYLGEPWVPLKDRAVIIDDD